MEFDLLQLVEDLERDEACKLKPYRDTRGFLTIGIGRNLDGEGITKGEAYVMLHNDIDRCVADLNTHVSWWTELDAVRQRVFLNMTFNMGIKKFLEFKMMIFFARKGDFKEAAREMLHSAWAPEVGIRAVRLSQMMEHGSKELTSA